MRKNLLRISVVFVVVFTIGAIGYTLWLRDRYVVPIITYHHIGVPSSKELALNTVSQESFDWQMNFLKKNNYNVISFAALVEGIKNYQAFPRNSVVVHFDDGYEDNYTYAYPILKKYQLPAMVFLVSDKIGSSGYLTWDEVQEMERSNFLAGAHTRHHKYLPDLSLEEAKDEIFGSKTVIEKNLGHSIDYFVYPSGGFSLENKELVKQAGFKAAATTNRGLDKFNHDLFELKRIRMNENDDRLMGVVMWAKLSGYYNLFRKPKNGS